MDKNTDTYIIRPNPQDPRLTERVTGIDQSGAKIETSVTVERALTIFLNSHLLSEVEATCDRIAVIRQGRVARLGTIDELSGSMLEVEIRAEGISAELLERLRSRGEVVRAEPDRVTLLVRERESLPAVSAAVVASGARLYAFTPRRLSLEELFLRVMAEP